MTLDALDRAFIDHWRSAAVPVVEFAVQPVVEAMPAPAIPAPAMPAPAMPAADPQPAFGDFVDRLLDAALAEWSGLVDEIEAARARGRRSIAIAACERFVGCSTIVEGLVRLLRRRGRDACGCTAATIPAVGATHDKRIMLVDAGVWFPPGRIHRQRLLIATGGCDAAILIRRSGREPSTAWAVALEAIGVEPLGEVLSFVPQTTSANRSPDHDTGDSR